MILWISQLRPGRLEQREFDVTLGVEPDILQQFVEFFSRLFHFHVKCIIVKQEAQRPFARFDLRENTIQLIERSVGTVEGSGNVCTGQ